MRGRMQRGWMPVRTREDLLVQLAAEYRDAIELGGQAERRFGERVKRFALGEGELKALRRMAYGHDDYCALDYETDPTLGGSRVLQVY